MNVPASRGVPLAIRRAAVAEGKLIGLSFLAVPVVFATEGHGRMALRRPLARLWVT